MKGIYMSIPFENLADPIISGKEELSMPKLYTAISGMDICLCFCKWNAASRDLPYQRTVH
jgi:hypothetical protein